MQLLKYIYCKYKFRGKLILHRTSRVNLNSRFEGMNKVYSNSHFSGFMGFGSYLASNSSLNASVGRFTSIGHNVHILKGQHSYTYPYVSTSPVFYSLRKQNGGTFTDKQRIVEVKRVEGTSFCIEIGNDCWVGDNVSIVSGCKIGDGAVLLAGAVVTKDVEPYSIVGGVPARVIRHRYNKDDIDYLRKLKWWDKSEDWIRNNVDILTDLEKLKEAYKFNRTIKG